MSAIAVPADFLLNVSKGDGERATLIAYCQTIVLYFGGQDCRIPSITLCNTINVTHPYTPHNLHIFYFTFVL